MTAPRLRQAVRAVVLDETDQVLLVHFTGGFWACPGGGIEAGESHAEALCRELAEEIGLDAPDVRDELWEHTRLFPMTDWDGQTDTVYLVRCSHFEPVPRVDLAAEGVDGVRWFTREEIAHDAGDLVPADLTDRLREVLSDDVAG